MSTKGEEGMEPVNGLSAALSRGARQRRPRQRLTVPIAITYNQRLKASTAAVQLGKHALGFRPSGAGRRWAGLPASRHVRANAAAVRCPPAFRRLPPFVDRPTRLAAALLLWRLGRQLGQHWKRI